MKYKWKVQPKPTGPYRSFYDRGWPMAIYENDDSAAALYCDSRYYPAVAKNGDHAEITVRIADHSVTPWQWRTLVKRAKTLDEAKNLVASFLKQNPHYMPKPTPPPKPLLVRRRKKT